MCPPEPSVRLITDTVEFGTREVPRWNTISISGYHIREAGSTAVQELAFTLADGIAYMEAAMERGLDVDEFAPRFSFFFNSHIDFFEEIAKFRAARRMWAKDHEGDDSRPKTHGPGGCGFTPRPRAAPSRPSSPTTMWCAQPLRPWPRSWAEPSPFTPIPWTKSWPFPRKRLQPSP